MEQKELQVNTWQTLGRLSSSETEDDFKDLQIVESDSEESESSEEDGSVENKNRNPIFFQKLTGTENNTENSTENIIENDFTPTENEFNKYPPVPDKPMPIFNFSNEVIFTEIERSRLKELMGYELIVLNLEKNKREHSEKCQTPSNHPPSNHPPSHPPATPKSILSQKSTDQHSSKILKTNETYKKTISNIQTELLATKSQNLQISSECDTLQSKLKTLETSHKQSELTLKQVQKENENLKQKNKQFQLDLGELNTEIIGLNMDLQVDVEMKNTLKSIVKSMEHQNHKLAVGFKDLTEKLNFTEKTLEKERLQYAEHTKLIEINQSSEIKSYALKQEALEALEAHGTSELNKKIADLEQQIYSAKKNLEIELEKQDEEHGVEKLELRKDLEASRKEQKKYQKMAETSMRLAEEATKQSAGLKKKAEEVEKNSREARKQASAQARLRLNVVSAASDTHVKTIKSLKTMNERLKIDNSHLNDTYDSQKQEIAGLRRKIEELRNRELKNRELKNKELKNKVLKTNELKKGEVEKKLNSGKRRGNRAELLEMDDKKRKNHDKTVFVDPKENEVREDGEISPGRKTSGELDPYDYDDFLESLKCVEK